MEHQPTGQSCKQCKRGDALRFVDCKDPVNLVSSGFCNCQRYADRVTAAGELMHHAYMEQQQHVL